ncbi:HtaA domain-containing protein [Microbacterium sp. NPDC056044]|uniref:HtaA domain-containing protein n=1 Tax=Microbacterium sp. NPDC056044 TaxID=3345690 RepID=UPI0035DD2648
MASLEWPIRRSLLAYVGELDDGEVILGDGAQDSPGGFLFPSAGADSDALRFSGAVTVTGYEGALTLPVVEPWIEPDDHGHKLTIRDPATPGARIRLVTIARLERRDDASVLGTGVALASPGSLLLTFGPYTAGTRFDDLRITV